MGKTVVLLSNGLVYGFKNFKKYKIHGYFGTFYPFQNYDVIFFGTDTPSITSTYNWFFSGDEFVLTEIVTENHIAYFLGKNS